MFTPGGPLFSVEEGDAYDGSLDIDEAFPKVEVPTWECKPLALAKHSS